MRHSMTAGVDEVAVTAWMMANVEGLAPPLTFELISGGRSNLTYSVVDAGGRRLVLRRPPLGHLLASAHDVAREHRIIAALGPTAVPVPEAVALCTDVEVNDAPFYVMGYADGVIARDVVVAEPLLDEAARAHAGVSMVWNLATLHTVDPDDVGLGTLGRKEGYVERQLKRWYGQYQQSVESSGRPVPGVDDLHARLSADIPEQGATSIVHGDYRIDNLVLSPEGEVVAILDWELCTLGDPLADLGMLLICWAEAPERGTTTARPDAPTQLKGFWSRQQVLDGYRAASAREVPDRAVAFHEALQYWKLACISAGVHARYASGAMGDQPDVDIDLMAQGPPRLAAAALARLDG